MPQYNIWNYNVKRLENGFKAIAVPNSKTKYSNHQNEFEIDVTINKYGFRDHNDLKSSSPDDLTILGDSFCFGFGVQAESRFGNVLEGELGKEIKVFNLGIPNCHFLNYRENLKFAIKNGLKSRKMIFGICMENDLLDYQNLTLPKSTFKLKVKNWLHKNSSLYAFVGSRIHNNKTIEALFNKLGFAKKLPSTLQVESVTNSIIFQSVELIEEIVSDYNEILILIIPSRYLWIKEYQEKAEESQNQLINELRKLNLKFIDMKPIFESISSNPLQDFYFHHDGHWNKLAHRIVGNTIAKRLHSDKQLMQ